MSGENVPGTDLIFKMVCDYMKIVHIAILDVIPKYIYHFLVRSVSIHHMHVQIYMCTGWGSGIFTPLY